MDPVKGSEMKTAKEIEQGVQTILDGKWSSQKARDVPTVEELPLKDNHAAELEGAVLYADLAESTALVDGYNPFYAAQVYKAFLFGCCETIRNNEGTITAFDGDRVMAIFTGLSKCSKAVKTGLLIKSVVERIQLLFQNKYEFENFKIDYAVGIDVSRLYAVRMGVYRDNDISWIGSAANHAAKLSARRDHRYKTFITRAVYERMNKIVREGNSPNENMWTDLSPTDAPKSVYGSFWRWTFS